MALHRLNMSMVFKKLQNKILVHMKTFDKPHIRVLDHLSGREKHVGFFSEQSLQCFLKVNKFETVYIFSVQTSQNQPKYSTI